MKTISPQNLSENIQKQPDEWLLVDVRSPGEFQSGHIPGAKNYPVDQFTRETAQQLANDANGRSICLICQSGKRSQRALDVCAEANLSGAVELDGGMNSWPADAALTEAQGGALPLMRQVQIVAGSCVFVGTMLGAFIDPWFLVIPAFFGAGLTFAGISGACGLAMVLTKMPWNQRSAAV